MPGRKRLYENGFIEHCKETGYFNKYYQDNKHKKIICCNCNKEVSQLSISSHIKSKKCLNYNIDPEIE